MDNGLVVGKDGLTINEHFTLCTVGVSIKGEPTFDEWREAVRLVNRCATGFMWWLGDLLNMGEQKWGEMYAEAMEATGLEYDTIAHAKYVCHKVEFWIRIQNLSFAHHRAVAHLEQEEQKQWLDLADKNRWSVAELRAAIRGDDPQDKPPLSGAEAASLFGDFVSGLLARLPASTRPAACDFFIQFITQTKKELL